MKLARQYFVELDPPQPTRSKFIARQGCYHGNTLGGLALSSVLRRRETFEPMLFDVGRVSACYEYRGRQEEEKVQDYVTRLAQELDDEFIRLGPENVCAFWMEPVVGAVRSLLGNSTQFSGFG
jgi:adenosylmethionine-8-amino-7-oxononanoate aminotransferase